MKIISSFYFFNFREKERNDQGETEKDMKIIKETELKTDTHRLIIYFV